MHKSEAMKRSPILASGAVKLFSLEYTHPRHGDDEGEGWLWGFRVVSRLAYKPDGACFVEGEVFWVREGETV